MALQQGLTVSAPSAAVIASLAPRWESISVHEVGHAVMGCLLDLPISHLTLTYERAGLFDWVVRGRTELVGGEVNGEDHQALLFALGGLEAESMWISSTAGVPMRPARAEVESRRANQGDIDEITDSLPGSGYTLDQAVAEVYDHLHQRWQTVTYLAAALRDNDGYLPGTEVARLV